MMKATALVIMALTAGRVLTAQAPQTRVADRLAAAIALPAAAREARSAGLPARQVAAALDALRGRAVPADEARSVLAAAAEGAAANGPVDNFGAFVQARLDQGLRGRELAAAIRAERGPRTRGTPRPEDTATTKRGRRSGGEKRPVP